MAHLQKAFDAWWTRPNPKTGVAPCSFMVDGAERATCAACGGNDREAPCAYPGEGKPGCLRDARLAERAPSGESIDADRYRTMRTLLADNNLDYYFLEGQPESEIDTWVDARRATAGKAAPERPDNFGEEVTRLIGEIRKPCSLAWRDSLVEELIDLIDPAPEGVKPAAPEGA